MIILPDDKRVECIARVHAVRRTIQRLGRNAGHLGGEGAGFRRTFLHGGVLLTRYRGIRGAGGTLGRGSIGRRGVAVLCAEDKFHLARRAQHSHHRILKQWHVVTLDPQLINIIRHAQRHLLLVGTHESNSGKPSLISVDVDLRLDASAMLSQIWR